MKCNGYSWVGDYDFVAAHHKKSLKEFENELGITHRLMSNPIDDIIRKPEVEILKTQ